jgi:hypothetical protein
MQGRRLPDVKWPDLPNEALQPGDYWKCIGIDLRDTYPSNLSRNVWQYYSPDGNGVGTLMAHTVREEDDGTISIRPGDGSSNSVLHSGGNPNLIWHGYVEHGVWNELSADGST